VVPQRVRVRVQVQMRKISLNSKTQAKELCRCGCWRVATSFTFVSLLHCSLYFSSSCFFSECDTENVLGPMADRRFWSLSCLSESGRASGQTWQEAATGLILVVRFRCRIIY
jgi:hypothetical protein